MRQLDLTARSASEPSRQLGLIIKLIEDRMQAHEFSQGCRDWFVSQLIMTIVEYNEAYWENQP